MKKFTPEEAAAFSEKWARPVFMFEEARGMYIYGKARKQTRELEELVQPGQEQTGEDLIRAMGMEQMRAEREARESLLKTYPMKFNAWLLFAEIQYYYMAFSECYYAIGENVMALERAYSRAKRLIEYIRFMEQPRGLKRLQKVITDGEAWAKELRGAVLAMLCEPYQSTPEGTKFTIKGYSGHYAPIEGVTTHNGAALLWTPYAYKGDRQTVQEPINLPTNEQRKLVAEVFPLYRPGDEEAPIFKHGAEGLEATKRGDWITGIDVYLEHMGRKILKELGFKEPPKFADFLQIAQAPVKKRNPSRPPTRKEDAARAAQEIAFMGESSITHYIDGLAAGISKRRTAVALTMQALQTKWTASNHKIRWKYQYRAAERAHCLIGVSTSKAETLVLALDDRVTDFPVPAQKMMTFVIQTISGQLYNVYDAMDDVEIPIKYSDFVKGGVYQTERAAWKAVKESIGVLVGIRLQIIQTKKTHKTKVTSMDGIFSLFPRIFKERGGVVIKLNNEVPWKLVCGSFFTILPTYAYSLEGTAFSLIKGIFFYARMQNNLEKIKDGRPFNISMKALITVTGLPSFDETKNFTTTTKEPIREAIGAILDGEAGRNDLQITLHQEGEGEQWIERSYISVLLQGDYQDLLTHARNVTHDNKVKAIRAAEERKIKVIAAKEARKEEGKI